MDYELIKYTENLPFKIIILNAQNQNYHWHKEMELIFLLKGNVTIEMKDKKYKLSEKDLFLINRFDIHSITPEKGENVMLTLQFDPVFFDQYCDEFSNYYYEPNSTFEDKNSPSYNKVSMNLAEIMVSIIKLNAGYKLKALNSIIEIALILIQNFRTEKQSKSNSESYKQERISDILNFIEDNYAYDINLNTLAEKVILNPKYVSQFFKEVFNINFTEYVNRFRINKSLNDLLTTNKNIIDISIEHGFNDHKAYNRVFKKYYDMTPSEYRNLHSKIKDEKNPQRLNDSYFEDSSTNYFKYIFEFLDETKNDLHNKSNIADKLNINLDLTKRDGKKLEKYWNKVLSAGKASVYLRQEVQKQVRIIQKEIGFEHIKLTEIFSDELTVYREDELGNSIYNWSYINSILDFFYDINLKPFIEIGFMPLELASKKQFNPAVFTKINVSYPNSLKKWAHLVSAFIKHCIERYGKDEVEKWYFTIWHSPNFLSVYWFDNPKSFFELFKETYLSIKKFSPNIKVGSPGILPINNFEWLDDFLIYCQKNSIILDFGALNIYTDIPSINNSALPQTLSSLNAIFKVSNKNFLKDTILSWKQKFDKNTPNNIEFILTEWNLTPFSNDYNHDTCFLSTYIVYNILNNIEAIDSAVFYNLSDIGEENTASDKLFHGGAGLFTYNGIKKPAYNAFYILNKLGDKIIDQGEDYIVTSSNKGYQVLIYNYAYFDELFKTGDKSLLSYHNRYNIFDASKQDKSVNIILSLESGEYRIKRFILNREFGSSFDVWLEMGAPEVIHSDVYDYIKSRETPKITLTTESVKKQLILDDLVPVHGILLIEISKI